MLCMFLRSAKCLGRLKKHLHTSRVCVAWGNLILISRLAKEYLQLDLGQKVWIEFEFVFILPCLNSNSNSSSLSSWKLSSISSSILFCITRVWTRTYSYWVQSSLIEFKKYKFIFYIILNMGQNRYFILINKKLKNIYMWNSIKLDELSNLYIKPEFDLSNISICSNSVNASSSSSFDQTNSRATQLSLTHLCLYPNP